MKARKSIFVLFMLVCVLCSLLFSVVSVGAMDLNVPANYHFTDYDSYSIYAHSGALYKTYKTNFHSFDKFRVLGEFRSASFYNSYSNSYYDYGITDSNGYELQLWAQPDGPIYIASQNIILFPGKMENMTALGVKKSGSLVRGPLEYVYEDGLLTCIVWSSGKTEFAISNGAFLYDYPLTGEATIIQRLLSTDKEVALAALEELTADIPEKLQPRTDLLIRIIYHSLLFIVPVSAIIMLLTKKRRIKRMVRQYVAASSNA